MHIFRRQFVTIKAKGWRDLKVQIRSFTSSTAIIHVQQQIRTSSNSSSISGVTKDGNSDDDRKHAAAKDSDSQTYSELQITKPFNPRRANKTSTLRSPDDSNIPSIGAYPAPPKFLSSASAAASSNVAAANKTLPDGNGNGSAHSRRYLNDSEVVSSLENSFKISPLRRTNEDLPTLRSRLQYQSRKRGILETDLLLSTFADTNLDKMAREQLTEYDRFLEENDWDIYYWATQEPHSDTAGLGESHKAQGGEQVQVQQDPGTSSSSSSSSSSYGVEEWAQTVGKKKEPYRVPPERWRHSSILKMIRTHVQERKANAKQDIKGTEGHNGHGLGRMPDVKRFQ